MFYHDGQLQYQVRVDNPNPMFAKMLQQAIGGIEGEMRVAMQYLFQAWATDDPKYRDMLLETGTEELAHIEMLSTAVTLNLRGSAEDVQAGVGTSNPLTAAMLSGMSPRHYLSAGLNAAAADSEGNPFNGSWIVASGNLASDMYANVMAESTGRLLACRLYDATDDPGMKDMLSFLIARDTMHQNQWLAVLDELGGPDVHPIPNSFPREQENQEFSYAFISTKVDGEVTPEGRWTQGRSIDGRGEFSVQRGRPHGQAPTMPPQPMQAYQDRTVMERTGAIDQDDKGMVDRITESLSGEEEHPR